MKQTSQQAKRRGGQEEKGVEDLRLAMETYEPSLAHRNTHAAKGEEDRPRQAGGRLHHRSKTFWRCSTSIRKSDLGFMRGRGRGARDRTRRISLGRDDEATWRRGETRRVSRRRRGRAEISVAARIKKKNNNKEKKKKL